MIARYRPHCLLGAYEGNLDDLVEETCVHPSQYDASFKTLRVKRKEVEKLPSFEKVDCITVSLAPLKSALEDQHSRLSDALQLGMRRTAAGMLKEINGFITESLETLAKRPQSVDEVGDAKRSCRAIEAAAETHKESFKKLDELNRLISQVPRCETRDLREISQPSPPPETRPHLSTLSPARPHPTPIPRTLSQVSRQPLELAPLTSQWEELELTVGAFNERIEDQMEHLRGQMSGRVSELQLRLEKFSARWFELKPKRLDTGKRDEMDAVLAKVGASSLGAHSRLHPHPHHQPHPHPHTHPHTQPHPHPHHHHHPHPHPRQPTHSPPHPPPTEEQP